MFEYSLKNIFLCMFVCNYLQKPIEGVGFPRSTVKGGVHPVMWVLGPEL